MIGFTTSHGLDLTINHKNAAFQCGMYLSSLFTKNKVGKRPKQQPLYQIRKKLNINFYTKFSIAGAYVKPRAAILPFFR